MAGQTLIRVQEKGQVTLPAAFRRRLGLKKGDLVAALETDEGVLIVPQEVVAARLLDRIGKALKEKGINLDELIESGRDERLSLIDEQYGIRPDAKA